MYGQSMIKLTNGLNNLLIFQVTQERGCQQ